MAENIVQARVEAIRRFARRRASKPLEKALEKSSPSDIAEAMAHLTRVEAAYCMEHLLKPEVAGEVLLQLNDELFNHVTGNLPLPRLLEWLDAMEQDDATDVIARLPEAVQAQVLERVTQAEREQFEELLAWPSDSAGGIMSPVAFRINDEATCREAISALQEQGETEMVFYVYVENETGQLVGVTSLRQLLMNPPNRTMGELMTSDVITVSPETDQEQVARIASRYSLLAVPVVDEARHLLGIVTVDDVLDVVREEAQEDLLKMAGVGEEYDPTGSSTFSAAKQRVRWLLVTAVGGIVLSQVIGSFQATLAQQAMLTGFIPVVMGTGGNVGIQAATIAVRNIALGGVNPDEGSWKLIFREARVGIVIGVVLAALVAIFGMLRYSDTRLGITVGVTIITVVTTSAMVGTTIPLVLSKLRVDPAVATGPFVTTSIDLWGIVIYLLIASQVFHLQ